MSKAGKYLLIGFAGLAVVSYLASKYWARPLTESFKADAECMQLHADKNYAAAHAACERASAQSHAVKGPSMSDVILARMYYQGQGVEKDYARAVELIRPAADAELGEAQFWLGTMLMSRSAPSRKLEEAESYLSRAALHCQQMAALVLAAGHKTEDVFGLDLVEAHKWEKFLAGQTLPKEIADGFKRDVAETETKLTPEQKAAVLLAVEELGRKSDPCR